MSSPVSFAVRAQRPKVFWSENEKARIVAEAADIQTRRPDLAGLPLLRAAMMKLPPPRRRRVIALSMAPWFEPGVADEIKRRDIEAKANANLAPLIQKNADLNQTVASTQAQILTLNQRRTELATEGFGRMIALLEEILTELRAQREFLNHIAVARPPQIHRPNGN